MSEPSRLDVIRTAQMLLARLMARELDEPHVVIVYDPQTKAYSAVGPFPDASSALFHADKLLSVLNSPENNDGEPVTVSIGPIDPPERSL